LEVIANKLEDFDAVAIIRGGGGDVGLSSYNNYFLSKAIAIFPIPVLTGIGHSTNETVSEMVAYKNAITPSELADFLLQKFHNFAIPVDNALERMLRAVRRNFEEENLKLKHIVSSISWNSKTLLLKDKSELNGLQTHLIRFSRQNIKENQAQLQHLERMLGIVNPIHILKRGFSIVRIDGKSVHKLDQVEIGAELEIQLEDGKVISKVINKESKHGK